MAADEAREAWRILAGGPAQVALWEFLPGGEVVRWSGAHRDLWAGALELVADRLPSRTIFAQLTAAERGAALRALPAVEPALLFENFSRPWGPDGLPGDWLGDARGSGCGAGRWTVGPGTFVLPEMERRLAGPARAPGQPLSAWCLRMANEDPLSDLDPSGLVWCFREAARPSFAAFRCRPAASRPHRCGGVFSLAEGLGNDKGPEGAALFVHFTCDPDGRHVSVQKEGGGSVALGRWRDGEWCSVRIFIDWDRRVTRCQLRSEASAGGAGAPPPDRTVEVPFKSSRCGACRFLLLYNQTCNFEASWTDILVA